MSRRRGPLNVRCLAATAAVVVGVLITGTPAGAAGAWPRYASASDTTPVTVEVWNHYNRTATVVDTATGVVGTVRPWGTVDLTEPAGVCHDDWFYVGWQGGGFSYYYWPVNCGTPTA